MIAMEENARNNPEKKIDIQRTLHEDDFVAILSRVQGFENYLGVALIHIFRLLDKKTVELWDFGQEVPSNSINKNGMFWI